MWHFESNIPDLKSKLGQFHCLCDKVGDTVNTLPKPVAERPQTVLQVFYQPWFYFYIEINAPLVHRQKHGNFFHYRVGIFSSLFF